MFLVSSSVVFDEWWEDLSNAERESIAVQMRLLQEQGPTLGYPHSSKVYGSRHRRMRELRIQHAGLPYRILYIFDPNRTAILLVGGRKSGNKRWYDRNISIADRLYDEHIARLKGRE